MAIDGNPINLQLGGKAAPPPAPAAILCTCGVRGAGFVKCPLPALEIHKCAEWLKKNPHKLLEKSDAEKERVKADIEKKAADQAAEDAKNKNPAVPVVYLDAITAAISTGIKEGLKEVEEKLDTKYKTAFKRAREDDNDELSADASAARRTRFAQTGADDTKSTDAKPKVDSLLRKGPLSGATLTDAEALARLFDEWNSRPVPAEWRQRVSDAIRTLRAEVFTSEADIVAECMVASSVNADRTYTYKKDPALFTPSERNVMGTAMRIVRGWGTALREILRAWAVSDSAADRGSAYVDSSAKCSVERALWLDENPRRQAAVLGARSCLPSDYELSQPSDLTVLGLHIITIRPENIETHLARMTAAMCVEFKKESKGTYLNYTAWNAKYGRAKTGNAPLVYTGMEDPRTNPPQGGAKSGDGTTRKQPRRKRGGGGGGGGSNPPQNGGNAPQNGGGGGGGRGGGGGGNGGGGGGNGGNGKNTWTAHPVCQTCKKKHPGVCRYA